MRSTPRRSAPGRRARQPRRSQGPSRLQAGAALDVPASLSLLEHSRLIRDLGEGEPAFAFKHALVQQAAYESMLVQERRDLHRLVGQTLAARSPAKGQDMAEVLATHFEQAGDLEKALEFAELAAVQAMRRFATAEAAGLYERAIRLGEAIKLEEARRLDLYQRRARALELGGDFQTALAVYEALETLGRTQPAPRLELAGIAGAASLRAVPTPLFDPGLALEGAQRALALAKSIGDPAGEARAYWLVMLAQTRINPSASIEAGEAALALARRHGLRELEAYALNDIQSNYQMLRQPSRALEALQDARPIWSELDNLPMLADNLSSTALLHVYLGEYDEGIRRSREALAISDRIGNLWGQSYARVAVALARFALGDLGRAIRETSQCIEISEQAGFLYPQVALRAFLAFAYGEAGDLDTASRLAERIRMVEAANPISGQVSGASTLAWIAVRSGDLDRAGGLLKEKGINTAYFTEAMTDSPLPLVIAICAYHIARHDHAAALEATDDLIREFETFRLRVLRPLLSLTRGRALRGLGRHAEARAALLDAHRESVEQGVQAGLWQVEAELGAMAKTDGDAPEADRWVRSAATHLQALAEGLDEAGLKERFLAQPHIRSILDEARLS